MRFFAHGVGAATFGAALSVACYQSDSPPIAGLAVGGSSAGVGGSSAVVGGSSNGAVGGAGATQLLPFAGAPALPPLEVRAPDATPSCKPELCTVISSWDLSETDARTVEHFQIATSSDKTYVLWSSTDTTNADRRQRFAALDATGNYPIDQGPVPQHERSWLAVGTDGLPRVVGALPDSNASHPRPPVEEDIFDGTTWSRSTIEGGAFASGFEIDRADRSRIRCHDAALAAFVATHESNGTWTRVSLPRDAAGTFALDGNGRPLSVSVSAHELLVVDEAGSSIMAHTLSAPVAQERIADYAAGTVPPQPIAARGTDFGVALLLNTGLQVLLAPSAGGAPLDVAVPNTQVPAFSCAERVRATQVGECAVCPDGCVFSGSGLASPKAFALTRTQDGAFWLAYVISELEIAYRYELSGGEAGCVGCRSCWDCLARVTEQRSSSTLHVVRITPDGLSAQEALTLSLGSFAEANWFSEPATTGVRIRAFGQRVAVAVPYRTYTEQAGFLPAAGLLVTAFDAVP
jgi:hypothetical protein